MNQSVSYYRWEIPVGISDEKLKEVVEEISIEKRMAEAEVEQNIKQKFTQRDNFNLERTADVSLRRRRYSGSSAIL